MVVDVCVMAPFDDAVCLTIDGVRYTLDPVSARHLAIKLERTAGLVEANGLDVSASRVVERKDG